MKSFSVKLDLRVITTKFKGNSSLAFYIILALIFVFEIGILYSSAKQVLKANQAPEGVVASKGVRLNINGFEESVKRINAGKTYYPNTPLYQDPFGTR